MQPDKRAYFRNLSLSVAILPLLTFNVCYLIAATLQHVPACIPYLEGCTSVSSTGRVAPEGLLFRIGMFASAIVYLLLWQGVTQSLRANGVKSLAIGMLRVCSAVAVLSLLVYALTIGLQEPAYRVLRRFGINGFALGNFLAQLAFVLLYRPLRTAAGNGCFTWLVGLCIALPLIGIAAALLKLLGLPGRAVDNIAAWNGSLLVAAYYVALASLLWNHKIPAGRATSPSE